MAAVNTACHVGSVAMEHRLGRRHKVNYLARVRSAKRRWHDVRVCNVSHDGLYMEALEGNCVLSESNPVEVVFAADETRGHDIVVKGIVCHRDHRGCGVMASQPVGPLQSDNTARQAA